MGDSSNATAPLPFMGYVHPDREIAAEGPACGEKADVSPRPAIPDSTPPGAYFPDRRTGFRRRTDPR